MTSHQPGRLHQQNKPFKSKHKTKGAVKGQNQGRIEQTRGKGGALLGSGAGKEARRNAARQRLAMLRADKVAQRRSGVGSEGGPPKTIVILPTASTSGAAGASALLDALLAHVPGGSAAAPSAGEGSMVTVMLKSPAKQRVTFVAAPPPSFAALDCAKVADILVLHVSALDGVDDAGEAMLSALCVQGVPTIVLALTDLHKLPPKAQAQALKYWAAFLETKFPDDSRLMPTRSPADLAGILRHVAAVRLRAVHWRDGHAHLLAQPVAYDAGTLVLRGHVRGRAFGAGCLVHLPGAGEFQLARVRRVADPTRGHAAREAGAGADAMTDEDGAAPPSRAARLASLPREVSAPAGARMALRYDVEPDALLNEQTWPTMVELDEAARARARAGARASGPAARGSRRVERSDVCLGAEYASAWDEALSGEEGEGEGEEEDEEGDESMDDGEEDAEGSDAENERARPFPQSVAGDEDDVAMAMAVDAIDGAADLAAIEEARRQRREADEDERFPDEVDTPTHMPARERFQRFRGLKSFRTSPWDPKESLPPEYARIYQFENFKLLQRQVLEDEDEAEEARAHELLHLGELVDLHLEGVPPHVAARYALGAPALAVCLHAHENKLSVVHYTAKRHAALPDEHVVRSKRDVIIQCGFRRYVGCPTYSDHSVRASKHKMDKFLHPHRICVASVFAPAQFAPAPLTLFALEEGALSAATRPLPALVATGSLLGVDADRIALKKIVLTGHPFRVHKRKAVVRWMFFSPEDIHWFKPVELFTKMGRVGHITESLGTHGYMKCIFDGPLMPHDTVCMNLYKRAYPKWGRFRFTEALDGEPAAAGDDDDA